MLDEEVSWSSETKFEDHELTINEIKKEIKGILTSNPSLKNYADGFDEMLVFSRTCLPIKNAVAGRIFLSQNKTRLLVYFDETIRCFQCILFKVTNQMHGNTRFETELLEISEIYNFSGDHTLICLLECKSDAPILVCYSRSIQKADNFFTVELDLERLTKKFPRLVERLAGPIVFLGEVLFAGEYS